MSNVLTMSGPRVTMPGISIQSIAITTPPTKTEYMGGESFNPTGMVVTGTYSNGATAIITGYNWTPDGGLGASITEVTIQYTEGGKYVTATTPVTVTKSQGSITLNPTRIILNSDTQTATCQVSQVGNGMITVQSSNPDLVSADFADGIITVKSLGTTAENVTINVSMAETDEYTGASAVLSVRNYISISVFGVSWDQNNQSTQLVRLTPETDPYGIVTETVSTEPQPAIGTGGGSSPFDAFMPWSGMERYNIVDGVVKYKQGDEGFSQTEYDTVVYIPPFYYRREESGSNQLFYVSDMMFEGAELHPGSDSYIARYICTSAYQSISGQAQIGTISITTARNGITARGSGWQLQDVTQVSAYGFLYLIEFAGFNGMVTIGKGLGLSNSGTNGLTDSMTYHTGAVSDGNSAIQYRWIENPFQQRLCYVDGLYGSNAEYYIQMNPSQFSNNPIADATKLNMSIYTPSTYATKLQIVPGYEWAILSSSGGGSSSTYVCEYGGTNYPSTSPIFSVFGNNMVFVGSCGEGADTTYSYRAARAGFREATV